MTPCFDEFDRLGLWRKMALLFFAFALSIAAGCGKSSSPPAANPQAAPPPANSVTVSSTPAPAPAELPIPQSTTTTNSTSLTTVQFLNRAMVRWMRTNHRHPRSFEEFASTANVQIPDPPPGKKYALNGRGFIVLVDNSTQ
ncbi:MAG TPA: hypothetical protein VGY56_15710 [Verrucomicrobiae bacterium]|nr:hypothetical protein [Verrucomicrobiae bacterium]